MDKLDMQTVSDQHKKISHQYPSDLPNEIIEEQTKKVPNLVFLVAAGASVAVSAFLTFGKKNQTVGNFVGLWAPTILLLGLYNKMVKVEDELLKLH